MKVHPCTGLLPDHQPAIRAGGTTGNVGHFGMTRDFGQKHHDGTDYLLPNGSPIFAAHHGDVVREYGLWQKNFKGYGRRFYLRTNEGGATIDTLYAHLSIVLVKPGVRVRCGDLVGFTGRSGNMAMDGEEIPDHLHFGVKYNGKWFDPELWLYDTMITRQPTEV